MKIFINAGHGGVDPGAVSKNGTKEKDITKNVAALLVYELIQKGYEVEFFQQKRNVTEVSAAESTSNSDLFISLHCNSFNKSSANGLEVLYYTKSKKGKNIAQIFQDELLKTTNLKDRKIKARDDLHVLKRTASPAVLVELAFLSNETEESLLLRRPEIFVEGLLNAVEKIKKNKDL